MPAFEEPTRWYTSAMPQAELCLVTGAAGFIGSHLCERLLRDGYRVIGVDAFTDYYSPELKRSNLHALLSTPGLHFVEGDLCQMDLAPVVEGADYIFHQAGQGGVRKSFGRDFGVYVQRNLMATQQLLEAARGAQGLKRFIYASSSSIYGDSRELPLRESTLPQPISPYGVTKLAGEQLACLYAANFQVPTVSLRYFTVYGPRQRPDMAFHIFLCAIYAGEPVLIYGDGEQTRDFTYISDVVQANILAMTRGEVGAAYNISGGSRVTVNRCLEVLRQVTCQELRVIHQEPQYGEMRHTYADISAAQQALGYEPRVTLEEGLAAEDAWFREVILAGPRPGSGAGTAARMQKNG
jgi:nucleoside-diphosphate-sugar epimerase